MKKLDVLYAINNSFIDMMLTSVTSMIINGNIEKLNLHIITSNFNRKDYARILEVVSNYSNTKVEFYPLEELNIEKYKLPDWRGTQIANARLFFQELLNRNLDNINNLLYLDADTLVISSIDEIKKYNSCDIGAVIDSGKLKYFKNLGVPIYYNSGVLYINTSSWINNHYQDKIVEDIKRKNLNLILPDQDILNYSLGDKITPLPLEYNMNSYQYLFDGLSSKLFFNNKIRLISHQDVVKAKENPKILHACGFANIKPWSNNSVNPFNDQFMEYLFKVNPNFSKEELTGFRKILGFNPYALKLLLLVKNYCPENIDNFLNNVHLKLQKSDLHYSKTYKKKL